MKTLAHPQTLSDRIENLTESQTLAMSKKARELIAKGVDVINLSLGEPNFPTPEPIVKAAMDALQARKYTYYTPVSGYLDLREAICEKFKRDNELSFTPEQIIVSTGVKQSVANVILSVINPGDEVLIPSPYWVSYNTLIQLAEGVCKTIPSSVDTHFKIDPQQIKDAITPRTRMLIFSSPCNPSGTVLSEKELAAWAEVLKEHENIVIVSDEIYEYINFTGKHHSIGSFQELRDRVVILNGLSKSYAMTGWRLGYMAAPLWIAKACEKVQGQVTSATCSITQRAAIVALKSKLSETDDMLKAYLRRRDLMAGLLKKIPGLKFDIPQGAFYIFTDVSSYFGTHWNGKKILSAEDMSFYLLEKAHVALVPGEAFGDPNSIRFVYAAEDEKICKAVDRIEKALGELRR